MLERKDIQGVVKIVRPEEGKDFEIEPGWSLIDVCPIAGVGYVSKSVPGLHGYMENVQVEVPVTRPAFVLHLVDEDVNKNYLTAMESLKAQLNNSHAAHEELFEKFNEQKKELESLTSELKLATRRQGRAEEKFVVYKEEFEKIAALKRKMENDIAKIREVIGSREMDRILEEKNVKL